MDGLQDARFVVIHTTTNEVPILDGRLKGWRIPQLQRVHWLHLQLTNCVAEYTSLSILKQGQLQDAHAVRPGSLWSAARA